MRHLIQGFQPVGRLGNCPPIALQHGPEPRPRLRIVIDYKDVAGLAMESLHHVLELVPFHRLQHGVSRSQVFAQARLIYKRHHHDRNCFQLRISLERGQHRPAIHLRHHHVEQNRPGMQHLRQVQPLLAVRRDLNRKTLTLQKPRQQLPLRSVVIDHQYQLLVLVRLSTCFQLLRHGVRQHRRYVHREGGPFTVHAGHVDVAAQQPAKRPRNG